MVKKFFIQYVLFFSLNIYALEQSQDQKKIELDLELEGAGVDSDFKLPDQNLQARTFNLTQRTCMNISKTNQKRLDACVCCVNAALFGTMLYFGLR